jgi:hypothetical protein
MPGRFLIQWMSRIVPRAQRAEWWVKWDSSLANWWLLVQRGELPGSTYPALWRHLRDAFGDAIWLRFDRAKFLRFAKGPWIVFAAAALWLTAVGAASGGFRNTRLLIDYAGRGHFQLIRRIDPFGVFLSYSIPIVFALLVGLIIGSLRGAAFHRYGWRYWAFFAGKTAAVAVCVPLLWIELAPVIRALRPNTELAVLLTALVSRLIFIVAFGCALAWCFSDQRRRCPVCLKRLAMPVTLGIWGSTFEPVTTEFLCEDGHGSLSVPENEAAPEEKWIKLDESWSELFDNKR